MPKNKLIFISDIHIGHNIRTNWYQRSIHEPYLLAVLEYIINHADTVQELILLHDLHPFAKRLANVNPQKPAKVVIMGHSHIPILEGLDWLERWRKKSNFIYLNSWLNCPSIPGMENKGQRPTFVEVEIHPERYIVSVRQVVKMDTAYKVADTPLLGPASIQTQ